MSVTVAEILNSYRKNRGWVDKNLDRLSSQYAEGYIGVVNQSVIAAGHTIEDLHQACSQLPSPPSKDELTVAYISREPRGMLL